MISRMSTRQSTLFDAITQSSLNSQDDVNARVSVHKTGHLTDLESKGRILEWLLHLAGTKEAKISAVGSRATLAALSGNLHEVISRLDRRSESLNIGDGLLLRASDRLVPMAVVWVARTCVLLQNVTNTDLL